MPGSHVSAFGRRRFMLGLAALFGAAMVSRPTFAASLDELRRSGAVGERYDGFLVVRDSNVSGDVRQQVAAINAERRSIYQKRANEQGVPADQVGRVYAQQIIQNAPSGTWFLGENGQWRQK